MPGVIALQGWSYGGSILTFAFFMPTTLFIIGALLVLFTKPHTVPGHRYHLNGGPVVSTPQPGVVEAAAQEAPPNGAEDK